MEGETYRTYLDHSLMILKKLLDNLPEKFSHLKNLNQTMLLDLKFHKMPINDRVEVIYEGLIFLLAFVVDPPKEDIDVIKLILAKSWSTINELSSFIHSTNFEKTQDQGISKAEYFPFIQKIDRVKAEVRQRYVKTQHSPEFNSPQIVGFLDSLLENLDKMLNEIVNFFPLVRHQVELVQEELLLLRPSLYKIMKSQNEHKEHKRISTQIISMIYNVDYVIKLCSFIDVPIWYSIICLYDVIQEIELIKFEVNIIYNKKATMDIKPRDICSPQDTNLEIGRAFIGFKKDVESIISCLTRGQKQLTIISISGLPGQGKTTVAKRICNDPKIQFRFEKIVWCYVSKEFLAEKLLINIIHDVCEIDVEQTKIQDLIEHLRKKLKGKRYLIVMDDIWDVDAWRQIERAFPDDKNGSRILFTSRNHSLASQAKSNSISHHLPLFSDKESWELMEKDVFHYNVCPPELLEIGKQIATYCKGLPLAVVLIAALLGRIQKKVNLWEKVAENLKLHLLNEGCMDIIELSYKYLPDNLKPCFLYFSAFQRGENVCAKKLKLLWIAEGFIKNNEMQCSKDLANEYLDDIISQNLVMVTERNSKGGIKTCTIHDLLYDLCMEKAKEENILHWAEKSLIANHCYSNPQKYCHQRLCIHKIDSFIKSRPICAIQELPTSRVHSFLWFYYSDRPVWKDESIFWFVKSFKVLTVLDLDGVYLNHAKPFEAFVSLIHLRYLAIKIKGSIVGIPPSIVNLWKLETLIVRASRFSKLDDPLPISMWKMKSLRHVDLPCARLLLENLEENNIFTTNNIERIGTMILKYDQKTMEFLKKLPKLRKLVCHLEMNEYNPKWSFMYGSLTQLESLTINGCALKSSNSNWKRQIFNFLKIENLTKLSVSDVHLSWNDMSTIGKHLPKLQVLKLNASSFGGTRWNLKDVCFSKLKYLKLSCLYVEQIDGSDCEENPFPCLEHLLVLQCYVLREIPSVFGDICTLTTIKLDQFTQRLRASAEQILKNQRDMGNHHLQVYFLTPVRWK